ncbi:MAG: LysM domain-containing protein [Chloroflexota bacterium]
MRRFPYQIKLVVSIFVISLLLVACERPVPGSEGTDADPTSPVVVPTTAAPALPTQIPAEESSGEGEEQPEAGGEADPAPETGGEEGLSGEAGGGEGSETGGEAAAGGEQTEGEAAPDQTAPANPSQYIVQPGDTLFTIATRYNLSVEALAAANNISNVNSLSVGDTLVIPAEGTVVEGGSDQGEQPVVIEQEQVHVVQAGENLYRIGLRYGFTVAELATYNNLANPNSLAVGQQIRIPAQ